MRKDHGDIVAFLHNRSHGKPINNNGFLRVAVRDRFSIRSGEAGGVVFENRSGAYMGT